MKNSTLTLKDLDTSLHLLSERLGVKLSNSSWSTLVDSSKKENNLQGNEPVPAWIIDFVQCFNETKEVDHVSFEQLDDNTNLKRRLFGFIDSVIGGEWEYDGESESVAFEQIRMQGIIDYEGSNYYIITY